MASTSSAPRLGVLLVAHGTVRDVGELPEFIRKIRRGAAPPEGLLEELRERYEHIGGSPLLDITQGQARALAAELGLPTYVAMRLWHPFVEEVLGEIRDVDRLCVLPLAPFSVHVYREAARKAFEATPGTPAPVFAEPWGEEPGLVAAHARVVRAALPNPDDTEIVLTAHSLPVAAIRAGDPYCTQFEASARAVERALGKRCWIAYQSQGAVGGEWLGPSLEETFISLAEVGARRVAVAPIGFLADHVETLYDLDVAAAEQARCLGLELVRVPALNTDPGLIAALATVARRTLGLERAVPARD